MRALSQADFWKTSDIFCPEAFLRICSTVVVATDNHVNDHPCFTRPGDIWHNVIIACKQSRNPEDDTQGALAAAKHYNPKADPVLLGYTFIGKPLKRIS